MRRLWLAGVAMVGAAAAVGAAALFWLVVTSPVEAAALVGGRW